MADILLKSASFVCLIALGYFLKHKGMFGKTDFKILSKIVINITLPCASIVSFSKYPPDISLLVIVGIGFGMNWLMLLIATFLSRGYERPSRAVWLNCVTGYNVGTFVLPFVQTFLSPAALVGTCLFNTGNALMCNGTTYAISLNMMEGTKGLNLKNIFKTLLRSVPFLTQVFLLIACIFGMKVPQEVVTFVNPASNANPFLAMFMIGLMLDLHIDKSRIKEIGGILLTRHIVAFIAAAGFFFLLPLELPLRQSVAIALLAPVGTISTAMAVRAGGDPGMAAGANSVSILISIPLILGLLALFGSV